MAQQRSWSKFGAIVVATLALAACGGATVTGTNERYPEKKRPEALRSASDGEVLGAHQQDPADTLDASLTNEHPAAGSPHSERPAQAAHERLDAEECLKQELQPSSPQAGAEPRKRPVCPPLSEAGKRSD